MCQVVSAITSQEIAPMEGSTPWNQQQRIVIRTVYPTVCSVPIFPKYTTVLKFTILHKKQSTLPW